mmetsp:Transcript_38471/g.60979  ORF Transcript_38471/g.60979 Transcript_38471/m.60979 type:complete len:107 (+) Transcript_38471:1151-1471(+)
MGRYQLRGGEVLVRVGTGDRGGEERRGVGCCCGRLSVRGEGSWESRKIFSFVVGVVVVAFVIGVEAVVGVVEKVADEQNYDAVSAQEMGFEEQLFVGDEGERKCSL